MLTRSMLIVVLIMSFASAASAVVLKFDDIPPSTTPGAYYGRLYGIGFDEAWYAADHTASTWGPPHSGSTVLAWRYPGYWTNVYGMMFKDYEGPLLASLVGGYFSTEPGVVLDMIGYYMSLDNIVASCRIGDAEAGWNNIHAEIGYSGGITSVEFRPVTTDALQHFCVDDIDVQFIPEPSSLLALLAGMASAGVVGARRRRG